MITILLVYSVQNNKQITEMCYKTHNQTITKYVLDDYYIINYIPIWRHCINCFVSGLIYSGKDERIQGMLSFKNETKCFTVVIINISTFPWEYLYLNLHKMFCIKYNWMFLFNSVQLYICCLHCTAFRIVHHAILLVIELIIWVASSCVMPTNIRRHHGTLVMPCQTCHRSVHFILLKFAKLHERLNGWHCRIFTNILLVLITASLNVSI